MTEASPVHLSRRTTFGAAAAGAALAAATFSGTSSVRAQARNKATFVLVHPAWFGGWCWKKVIPLLRARGYDVFAPTLTGLGDRAHLARPEIGLNTHVEDVANLLKYEDLSGVVLVGNSSGGMVITGVSDRMPERIAHVVYLDAFVPQDGQSMLDMQVSRRADDDAVPGLGGEGLVNRCEGAGQVIPLDHLLPPLVVGLTKGHVAADLLKAPQVPLANRATAHDEDIYRQVQPPSTSRFVPVT